MYLTELHLVSPDRFQFRLAISGFVYVSIRYGIALHNELRNGMSYHESTRNLCSEIGAQYKNDEKCSI
jgi:hypothetical protein